MATAVIYGVRTRDRGLCHRWLLGWCGHPCAGRRRAGAPSSPFPQTHRPRPQDVVPGAAAKPETTEVAATTGLALLVGALIDGIPQSAAIGLSCHSTRDHSARRERAGWTAHLT
jgi:hypothetical protein